MITSRVEQGIVETINQRLDQVGLQDLSAELVVVGGAALAACGIKDLRGTDIDLVVTEAVMGRLKHDPGWDSIYAYAPDGGLATTGIHSGLTAMSMPLRDGMYPVTSRELLEEGIVHQGSRYRFSPVERVLHWKLVLANSLGYRGDKGKHLRDAQRISAFLLETMQR